MTRTAVLLVTSLIFITLASAQTPEKPKKGPVALERMLHAGWQGGDCVGELMLEADGTFERQHYSPGNNQLTGTWEVRWDALPPTLILTCKASDSSSFVGKAEEAKLVQLDDEALVFQYPGGRTVRYARKVTLEEKLPGQWKGGACLGEWTFWEDGAFELKHFSPGDNHFTGDWKVRWNTLPPTLVLTFKTSDDPDGVPVGKIWEVKLVELDDKTFAYQYLDAAPIRYERIKK